MLKISTDSKLLTAVVEIEDSAELTFLTDAMDDLVAKLTARTTKISANTEIPQEDIDKLERAKLVNPKLAVGQIKLDVKNIYDLSRAVNEAIVNYEATVTDDPTDATLISYKAKLQLLNEIGHKDLAKRQ